VSGEAAATPAGAFLCDPLEPEVELPVRNVAIAGATTFNALNTTPETQTDAFYSKLYPRVLPPGETQVSVMRAIDPTFVSVEHGANEVLSARSGIAIPDVTIFPYAQWTSLYTTLINAARSESQYGILVGLINDAATFPGFRRGAEIWADRLTLLGGFHVSVDANCDASQNLIFVPVRIPTAVATGLGAKARDLPPVTFSCADGGLGVQDFVLTPAEVAIVNGQMNQMNGFIRAAADRIGYATFDLEVLYGRSDLKPPFSTVQLMTSAQPYGPYISLDGIHPNDAGHRILAQAAMEAINAKYRVNHALPRVAAND
jgi:phospholipase/lecithinase/hemolysin